MHCKSTSEEKKKKLHDFFCINFGDLYLRILKMTHFRQLSLWDNLNYYNVKSILWKIVQSRLFKRQSLRAFVVYGEYEGEKTDK